MTKEILQFALLFVVLVLCQVVVFNHICLFEVAIPLVFVYFLLKLPITLGVNWVLTLSFLLGLTIDLFSNTQGMNALACTVTGILRLPVLRLYVPRQDDIANPVPSVGNLGAAAFMKYAATTVTIYCTLFFTIEAFAFFDVIRLVLRILSSALLTFVIILAFDGFTSRR